MIESVSISVLLIKYDNVNNSGVKLGTDKFLMRCHTREVLFYN